MKKLISLLLAASMLLSLGLMLGACNGEDSPKDTSAQEQTTAAEGGETESSGEDIEINEISFACSLHTTTYDLASVLPEGGDTVSARAFEDYIYLESLTVPSHIRKISYRSFINNNGLVDIKIDETDASGKSKTRIQAFEGLVMAIQGSGISKTFTVRKISGNVGTEKTLPVNSPRIDMITVVRKGKVRRAKLNYLRDRVGKAAKVKELVK